MWQVPSLCVAGVLNLAHTTCSAPILHHLFSLSCFPHAIFTSLLLLVKKLTCGTIRSFNYFKKSRNALSLEKRRESAKGTGKGTGRELEGNWERERELEKHRTSHTLKKRKWKNTAFSITPGKGNWKNTAFSITSGKGNWKNRAFSTMPVKGYWKNTAFSIKERELEKHRNCNHAYKEGSWKSTAVAITSKERKWKKAGTEAAKRA